MLTILPQTYDDLLAVRVSKKLTAEDFDRYRALIKERMIKYNSVRLYFEMLAFDGWEAGSFVENAVFDIIHGSKFGKVAMVGEKTWQEWAARFASPVKRKGIKYFDMADKVQAMKWVLE